ncbi:conserved hypothetical protein [Lebetimonas natsushimae]|uniref:Porin domain-containing protein n=1 Tax=Lebetimonas natsushimae TaxID=1936991 RepID=A0A292YFD8_9BACT|nr:major outer membrane protein [Lebetimonas natsushimae]GAX87765.1 conserved hypothetical protein [Lebetimonas natsushimae]
MFFKRFSFAILLSMGIINVANATPLTEAIKCINVNGALRIRYYYFDFDDNANKTKGDISYNRWRTDAKLIFKVPVAENMKIIWSVNSERNIYDKATSNNPKIPANNGGNLENDLFYLNYADDKFVVNVGTMPLDSLPFISSEKFTYGYGTGVMGRYNINDKLKITGGWIDHLFNIDHAKPDNVKSNKDISNDLYILGLNYSDSYFGSVKMLDYQITDLIDNAFIIMTNLNFLKNYGIGINADFATSKLNDSVMSNADNHNFYNLELSADVYNIDTELGYAKTDSNPGIISTSIDAKIGHIPVHIKKNVANLTDSDIYYGKLGYKIDKKTKFYVSYAKIDQDKNSGDNDSQEYTVTGKCKFNKKFSFTAYYAYLNYNNDTSNDEEKIKAEFLYNF